MKEKLYRIMIELTNGPFTSKILQKFTQSKWSRRLIPLYMKTYNISSDELSLPLDAYPSLQEFFIRKLKDNARTITEGEKTIISPVDGVLEDWGNITPDTQMLVKGKPYSIEEMLGSKEKADEYAGGKFILLYLSPAHYHRIHSPLAGKVVSTYSLGSKSYPVNRLGISLGKSPLSKNFRLVSEFENEERKFALVKIGAMFVNSIEWTCKNENVIKGEELGYFSFGSSVVLLFPKGYMEIDQNLKRGTPVLMGTNIGRVK
ncbi:phosphatidylserine decarboxylase [Bacillus carboniphilus]|uniref:phosphatidylserine decarboxylase n=1 Tax=Bacillus carboniphilus TaxID=86663 RepID=UPI003CD091EC